jgi:hypothetical protein
VVSVPSDAEPWRPTHLLPVDPSAWFQALRTGVAMVDLYFDLHSHHDDWQRTHRIAVDAARRSGDRHGQAIMLRNLGQSDLYRDAYPSALDAFEQSLHLFRAVGDDRGAGIAVAGLSTVAASGWRERAGPRPVS